MEPKNQLNNSNKDKDTVLKQKRLNSRLADIIAENICAQIKKFYDPEEYEIVFTGDYAKQIGGLIAKKNSYSMSKCYLCIMEGSSKSMPNYHIVDLSADGILNYLPDKLPRILLETIVFNLGYDLQRKVNPSKDDIDFLGYYASDVRNVFKEQFPQYCKGSEKKRIIPLDKEDIIYM